MPNGKPRRPKLTPNQEAWRKEERRIKQILYRMEKAGFKFSREELMPSRPTKITKQSIERLKATTPAILRGYAAAPEGFKGKIETQKSKRKATYLTARGNGKGFTNAPTEQIGVPGSQQTAKATEARKKKAKARREAKEQGKEFRNQHTANVMSVIVANVEAELTSGPYQDVSTICLEKFRSLLATKPNFLYNNIKFAPDSLIEMAHVISYASEQPVRVQYGHLFLTVIYGGYIPESVSKEMTKLIPYGIDDYDVAWETESGVEPEKQAKAPAEKSKGGRPKKEVTENRRLIAQLNAAAASEQTNEIAENEMNMITDSLEFFDPADWSMETVEEKVTSKSGLTEYTKKKVVLVNKTTGEVVDYAQRLKQFVPRSKKGGEKNKLMDIYNEMKGKIK